MAASPLAPDHIVVVVEENHDYSDIVNNPQAQFINELASEGALFTNSHGVARPSQPNYFALFSGSTHGVADNKAHDFSAPTLAGQLEAAGYSFAGYAESGSPRKHNPWESFEDSKDMGKAFSAFPSDYSELPTVSFVSPNQLNDMHDGSVGRGDQWLEDHLGAYADWAKTHNSLLVVTFDEDGHGENQRIATIVVGDGVSPLKTGQAVNHYNLLHTIENFYGLPALGLAAKAPVMDLGVKDTPAEPPVTPPAEPPPGSHQISFQNGTNDYLGAADTMLRQADPNRNYAADTSLSVDGSDPDGTDNQVLLQFAELFGPGPHQIPTTAHVTSAKLTLETNNTGAGAELHRMLSPWSDTDTWDSYGEGVQADDTEAVAAADLITGTVNSRGATTFDVTKSVQAWEDDAHNYGWAFLTKGSNGWDFDASDHAGATRPVLSVTYDLST